MYDRDGGGRNGRDGGIQTIEIVEKETVEMVAYRR
jgi:hypothetical protein